jgi:hypothetical protein
MKSDDLIDDVHPNGENKDAANCSPADTDALGPVLRIGEQGPKIGRSAVARIAHSIADREYRCHHGLEE